MRNSDALYLQAEKATRRFTIDEAFAYCAELTRQHYENFPVASLLLPEDKRPYLQVIYAFARIADDFADEGNAAPEKRLALLDQWDQKLQECHAAATNTADHDVSHPVFVALSEAIRRLNLTIEPFRDLIAAFKMDVTTNRYATFDDVLSYCRHSANPVGRLVLMIFGYRDERLFKLSDNICTALQLANFWQDISIDSEKNRIYIPLEDFERFGCTHDSIASEANSDRFNELLKFEIDRTRELFRKGAELPSLVDKDLRLELKLVWFGGMNILRKTERLGKHIISRRPRLNPGNKLAVLLRALLIRNLAGYKPFSFADQWDPT